MYRSPLHIFDGSPNQMGQLTNREELIRLRRKMLAEFNLDNKITVQLDGHDFSRDDIIKTFDELIESQEIEMHLYIYSNKPLLEFLENEQSIPPKNTFNNSGPQQEFSVLNNLVAQGFRERIKKALIKRNFSTAKDLYGKLPLWKNFDAGAVNESIHRQLEILTEEVKEVSENQLEKTTERLSFLYNPEVATFLNRLSPDLQGAIDSFVSSVINLLVRYSRLSDINHNYLYKTSVMLTNVKCREDLMELIKNNHQVFGISNVRTRLSGNSNASSSSGWPIYIAISILIGLIRIASTCDRHSSSFDRYKTPVNFDYTQSSKFQTQTSNLKFYRSWQSSLQSLSIPRSHTIVPFSKITSGKSPFNTCFITNPLTTIDPDSLRKVIIENNSGYDLIVFTFNDTDVWSAYYYNGVPDTLYFCRGYKLCFYFGETLITPNRYDNTNNINIGSFVGAAYFENYFKTSNNESITILNKDYTLENKEWLKTQKKGGRKKKNKVPVVEITSQFFKADSIQTKQIKLYPLQPDSSYKTEDLLNKSVKARSQY